MNAVSPNNPRDAATPAPYGAKIRAAEAALNPLLEAARPLLDALATTPTALDATGVAQHRQWLVHQIRTFGKVCEALQLPATQIDKARYCLCSALDEAAGRTDWGNGTTTGTEWGTNGLATTFGYDRQGGDRVYTIASECVRQPHDNRHLIELIHNILERGFRGRYRVATDGAQQIDTVRAQIRNALSIGSTSMRTRRRNSQASDADASLQRVRIDLRVESPLSEYLHWLPVAVVSLFLLVAAGCVAYWQLTQAKPADQMTLPMDTLSARLNERLANEVSAGTVTIAQNAAHSALTLRIEGIFETGDPRVNPWVKPMITTIGQEIAKVPGNVIVTGHTDNQPFSGSRPNSNLRLSDSRAAEVAQLLVSAGVPADRINATGKGNAEPAADNRTPRGRQKNRRVEITVSE